MSKDEEKVDPKIMTEARERAVRAREYAEMFPQFSSVNDLWCQEDWQYEQLSRFAQKH